VIVLQYRIKWARGEPITVEHFVIDTIIIMIMIIIIIIITIIVIIIIYNLNIEVSHSD